MKRHGRETYGLGQTLVQEPRAFPGACGSLIKRSFRTMWQARGGGYYACGFVITFVWLEITTLLDQFTSANGVGSFIGDQLLDILLRFSVQSITNTVQAFVWPVLVIVEFDLWGLGALAISYLWFSQFLKTPMTNWLFADTEKMQGAEIPKQGEDKRKGRGNS